MGPAPGAQHPVRHGLAFLLSGGLAFIVDAAVLKILTVFFAIHPAAARIVAIAAAMVTGWLAHRRFTFRVPTPPTLSEFARYFAVGWVVSAINYAVFVALVLALPGIEPLYALFASSLIAMVFAYLGMRFGAFRQAGPAP